MTVLRLNTDEHVFPRRQIANGFRRRGNYSVFLSRQVRNRPAARCGVIAEIKRPQRAFSAEGLRGDVKVIALTLALVLFLCVLIADVSALCAGGDRIGRLSSGIASLEQDNDLLREEISLARIRARSYERQQADGEPDTVVVLSPAPEE